MPAGRLHETVDQGPSRVPAEDDVGAILRAIDFADRCEGVDRDGDEVGFSDDQLEPEQGVLSAGAQFEGTAAQRDFVVGVLWAATHRWRRPRPVALPEDVRATDELARERTRRVVIGSVLIVVAAAAMAVPAIRRSGDAGSAASKGPTDLTVTPPSRLGSCRLMTGPRADGLSAQAGGKTHKHWDAAFCTTAGRPTQPVVEAFSETSPTDPQLARELTHSSADYEDVNVMAGAGITDAKVFDPCPAGGKMRCGQNKSELLCGWADSGILGALTSGLTSGLDLQQIASPTREFRAAAEH